MKKQQKKRLRYIQQKPGSPIRCRAFGYCSLVADVVKKILAALCIKVKEEDPMGQLPPEFEKYLTPFISTYYIYFPCQDRLDNLPEGDDAALRQTLRSLDRRVGREVGCFVRTFSQLLGNSQKEIMTRLKHLFAVLTNVPTQNEDVPPVAKYPLVSLFGIVKRKIFRLLHSPRRALKAISFIRSLPKGKILWPKCDFDKILESQASHEAAFTRPTGKVCPVASEVLTASTMEVFGKLKSFPSKFLPSCHACFQQTRSRNGTGGLLAHPFVDILPLRSEVSLRSCCGRKRVPDERGPSWVSRIVPGYDWDYLNDKACLKVQRILPWDHEDSPWTFFDDPGYDWDSDNNTICCESCRRLSFPEAQHISARRSGRTVTINTSRLHLEASTQVWADKQMCFSVEKSLTSEIVSDVKWMPLSEPAKVRSLGKGCGYTMNSLLPLQDQLLAAWKATSQSTMMHKDLTPLMNIMHTALPECPYFVSVDYKSATDLVERWTTRLQLRSIDSPLVPIALQSFGPGKMIYDIKDGSTGARFKKTVIVNNGQPMGHVLSFPLLCNLNRAALKGACIRYEEQHCYCQGGWRCPTHELVRRIFSTAKINGDDIAFKAPDKEFIELFYNCTRDYGLEPSAGKQFVSKMYITLNSQDFVLSGGVMVRTSYYNQKWKLMKQLPKRDDTVKDLVDLHNNMVQFCPWAAHGLYEMYHLLGKFKTASKFPGFKPNFFLPYYLGGLGFELPEGKVLRTTKAQRLVAAHFVNDPRLSLWMEDVSTPDPVDDHTKAMCPDEIKESIAFSDSEREPRYRAIRGPKIHFARDDFEKELLFVYFDDIEIIKKKFFADTIFRDYLRILDVVEGTAEDGKKRFSWTKIARNRTLAPLSNTEVGEYLNAALFQYKTVQPRPISSTTSARGLLNYARSPENIEKDFKISRSYRVGGRRQHGKDTLDPALGL